MHPLHCERLVRLQLDEAVAAGDVFGEAVKIESFQFPTLFVSFLSSNGRRRLMWFDCANYDFDPMAAEPVDPETHKPLPPNEWPRSGGGAFALHPVTNRPFFCVSGLRDYYTHPSHIPSVTGKRWESDRPGHRIADILRHFAKQFSSGKWV
jgi:hypothetical protein